jgi:hypothetical protein
MVMDSGLEGVIAAETMLSHSDGERQMEKPEPESRA